MANIDTIMATDLANTAFDSDRAECPAEAISITPAGGEAVAGLAIVADQEVLNSQDELGNANVERLTVLVRQATFSAVTAGADTASYDGKIYRIERVEDLRALWRLELVREASAERSAEDLRRRR